jgi:hypothetical protein
MLRGHRAQLDGSLVVRRKFSLLEYQALILVPPTEFADLHKMLCPDVKPPDWPNSEI